MAQDGERQARIAVFIAAIGAVATLGAAIIGNWDKIFSNRVSPAVSQISNGLAFVPRAPPASSEQSQPAPAEQSKTEPSNPPPPVQPVAAPPRPSANDFLTGVWNGTYSGTTQPPVAFTLTASVTGDVLGGRISEPNTFGNPNALYLSANISGVVQGDRVTFTKTYDGTGGQTHSVRYAGMLDRDHGVLVGEWSLPGARGAFTLTKER